MKFDFKFIARRVILQAASFFPLVSNELDAVVFIEGGDSHMKGAGMLVVMLRGVNFGFWSHLGCSGQSAIIFSCEGLV